MYPLKKLSEICKILKGKNPNLFPTFKEGSKPYLSAKYIRGTQSPEYALETDSKSVLVEKDDIVIICDGSNSGESFSGIEGILSSTMGKIVFNDQIDRKYLKFFLDLIIQELRDKKTGTAIPHLDIKGLLGYNIPLPPLSTQLDIIARLDSAMAEIETLRRETESALASTCEIWESTLENAFTSRGNHWEEKRLGEIISVLNGFAFKSSDAIESSNTQLIRMGNLYGNQLDLDRRAVFYPDEFSEKYNKYILKSNDLIISLTGTTGKEDYGYTVKIPETNYNLLLNQRIAKIIILDESKTLKNYLLYFLLSRIFLDKLYKTANGTRQANLSTDTMRELVFFFPNSLPEQTRIVAHLDAVRAETEQLESLYTAKLANLDELRRSVLQEAFV